LLRLFLFHLFVINQFKGLYMYLWFNKGKYFGPFPNKSQTVLDI